MLKHLYLFTCLLAVLLLPTSLVAETDDGKQHILVLNSYNHGYAWTDNEVKGIQKVFAGSEEVILRIEYMDTKVINDEKHYQMLAEIYERKYKDLNFEVIITTDDDALKFMRRYRDEMFPDTPLVFTGVNNYNESKTKGLDNFTGVNETADFGKNLKLIRKLLPEVTELVIINDNLTSGKALAKEFDAATRRHSELGFTFNYLEPLPMLELQNHLSQLKPHQAVFYLSFFRDGSGVSFTSSEAIPQLSKAATVPIFGAVDYMIGKGILGGLLKSAAYQGEHAGMKAKKILEGASASDLPILLDSPHQYMFDYEQQNRFNINQKQLPQNSILINEPKTFYYRYKAVIWSTVTALSIMLAYIGALLLNIRHRARTQRGLQSILETSHSLFDVQAHQQFRHMLIENLQHVFPNTRDMLLLRYKSKNTDFTETDLAIVDSVSNSSFNGSAKKLIADAVKQNCCTYSKHEAVAKLATENSPVDLLYVNGKRALDKTDQQLFELFASNVAMSIDNAENYKLAASLQTAHRIQNAMLPTDFTPASRDFQLDLHAFIVPAKEVGGDLYDFFELDKDNFCLLVGDVSDKGVPAAIFMAMAKTVLRTSANINLAPADILYRANNELSRNNTETMFVTLFLVIINRRTGLLRYVNGGHNPPCIVRANGEVSLLKSQVGTALGVMEDLPYFTGELQLEDGDGVLLYTDGITEAMNEHDELYGEERLLHCMEKQHNNNAQTLNALLLKDLRKFVGDAHQSDDITSLFFRFNTQ